MYEGRLAGSEPDIERCLLVGTLALGVALAAGAPYGLVFLGLRFLAVGASTVDAPALKESRCASTDGGLGGL